MKVAAVIGIGPGLGRSTAIKFAKEGYHVALIARNPAKLAPVAQEIEKLGGKSLSVPADASDHQSLKNAFSTIRKGLGEVNVLVYNAGGFKRAAVEQIAPAEFEAVFKSVCFGAFLAVQEVLPAMYQRTAGTIIFTGATASIRGSPQFSALAVAKFGLRALAQSLAKEAGPKGVHVAHVIIDGQIWDSVGGKATAAEGRPIETFLQPDAIAELYWQLHTQHRSVWTFEQDVRPNVEKW